MSYTFKSICLKFILVLGLLQFWLISKSQYDFSEVDKLLKTNQKALGNNLAVMIYKGDKIVYQKEIGEFKIKTKAPIASASKWLTAALVMTFVDEGKLSLDEKISTYLPIFDNYSKSYITIRQCLAQETGIANNHRTVVKMFEGNKFESLEDEVNSFAKREIAANPGTTFFYGDIGLNIAGRVLEVLTKKKFESLMKQRIFTPLNMRNSSFIPEENAVNPSNGAFSTAADYMNFLSMILAKGVFMGKRILSEAAITQMQTIQTTNIPIKYSPKIAEGFEYGLGEWIQQKDTKGNSMVVGCPSLSGTWPYIDNCRSYACIVIVQNLLDEQPRYFYSDLEGAINKQITGDCK